MKLFVRRRSVLGQDASLVLVFAVVSASTERAVELFVRREDAEQFLDEVRQGLGGFGEIPGGAADGDS